MTTRSRPTAMFLAVLLFSFALYFGMTGLQPILENSPPLLFGYEDWFSGMAEDPLYLFFWMIGDMTEPPFFKSLLSGIFFFLSCLVMYLLDRKHSRFRMTPLCYGNGANWPWIFGAGFLSVVLSGLLYGSLRMPNDAGWVGTFVPFVCVPSAVIFLYGPGLKNLLTGAVLGAVVTPPICIFMRDSILAPLGLPGLIGVVCSMCLGGIICFELCSALPWMKVPPPPEAPAEPELPVPGELSDQEYIRKYPSRFFLRRLLAAFSEPMFIGNEAVGAALILGVLVSWLLNPRHPVYGSGLLPILLLSELLTGAVALYLYWDRWLENGYYPTFTPVVAVAPTLVLFFGDSIPIAVITAVIGGVLTPALAAGLIARQPANWHPVVGNTASMAISVTVVGILMKLVTTVFPILL